MNALATKHPGALTLRRVQIGEAVGADVNEHVASCDVCRAEIARFAEEQRQFEQEISFDRFAAGVERAARQAPKTPVRRRWPQTVLALAAGLMLIAGVQLVLAAIEPVGSGNRLKGGASVQVVVAGSGPQRGASENAAVPEALAAGERVRIGITPDRWRFALVVSIDDAGEVTPIYAEGDRSLQIPSGKDVVWLPDSLEFTGKGLEHVVIVLTSEPIAIEKVIEPLRLALRDARGDVTKLGSLPVPGEQFHRTFLKP